MTAIGTLVLSDATAVVELTAGDWDALGCRVGDRVIVEVGDDVFSATVKHTGGRYVVSLPCSPSISTARPRVRRPRAA